MMLLSKECMQLENVLVILSKFKINLNSEINVNKIHYEIGDDSKSNIPHVINCSYSTYRLSARSRMSRAVFKQQIFS